MNSPLNYSLISSKISKFYAIHEDASLEGVERCFFRGKCYDFAKLAQLMAVSGSPDLQSYTYDDYLRCFQQLQPIFSFSPKVIAGVSLQDLELKWLGDTWVFIKDEFQIGYRAATSTVEQVLLLTSVLENALGNIYYSVTNGRQPPHLLKDLISTDELREILGADKIFFLKFLLGSPVGVNLRNIVWHGFPTPNDIPDHFVAVIIITAHTIGCKMRNSNLELHQRPHIKDFTRFINKIDCASAPKEYASEGEEARVLARCGWLPEEYQVFWKQLVDYYRAKLYWRFVILVLPQIELLLRLVYGAANNYDVSAKLDEYYITMDTVFERSTPFGQENKVVLYRTRITEGALKCMYDLFIAPQGPRLRDRVSHGEVAMDAINNEGLCRVLLHLSLQLLTSNEADFPLRSYESKFHVSALAWEALHAANHQLRQLVEQHSIKCDLLPVNRTTKRFDIFHRPKKETQLLNNIFKISTCMDSACRNYESSLSERLLLLDRHELHSKRRRTLEKLLNALPMVCGTMRDILQTLEEILSDENGTCLDDANIAKILRFLKHILKVAENLAKYSDTASNEWIKALDLCKYFYKIKKELYFAK